MTSFGALSAIKRTVGKKVGHAGTLDKFAQGLLIVLTGSMTRLNPLFMNLDKRYRAFIRFGSETDTLDPEGKVIATANVPSYEEIAAAVGQFIGEIEQEPPAYSALHVDGVRASDRVRSGQSVQMTKRAVIVHRFELVTYEGGLLEADITVSKGTYIRSLARDLAHAVGSRAHLEDLIRTEIGPFDLTEAIKATDREAVIASMANSEDYLNRLLGHKHHTVSDRELATMVHGQYPRSVQNVKSGWLLAYDENDSLRAVLDTESRKIAAWVRPYETTVEN